MIAVINANSELIRLFMLVMNSITFLTSLSVFIITYVYTYVKSFAKKILKIFQNVIVCHNVLCYNSIVKKHKESSSPIGGAAFFVLEKRTDKGACAAGSFFRGDKYRLKNAGRGRRGNEMQDN